MARRRNELQWRLLHYNKNECGGLLCTVRARRFHLNWTTYCVRSEYDLCLCAPYVKPVHQPEVTILKTQSGRSQSSVHRTRQNHAHAQSEAHTRTLKKHHPLRNMSSRARMKRHTSRVRSQLSRKEAKGVCVEGTHVWPEDNNNRVAVQLHSEHATQCSRADLLFCDEILHLHGFVELLWWCCCCCFCCCFADALLLLLCC